MSLGGASWYGDPAGDQVLMQIYSLTGIVMRGAIRTIFGMLGRRQPR